MKRNWIKIVSTVLFLISFGLILGRNLPRILSQSAPDFTQVWVSANAMLQTNDPYFNTKLDYPNAYPPISEIFFLPLAMLTYHQALAVFTFFSFASILASVFLSLKITVNKVPWHYFLLFTALSLFSFPTKFSLGMGQINFIVLFFLLLGVYLETRNQKKSMAAGISLGFAIALKPIFAFFLLFLLVKRSWKVFLVSTITVMLLTAITFILWPISYWTNWYVSGILPLTDYVSSQIYVYPNQGLFGFLYKNLSNQELGILLNKIVTVILITYTTFTVSKRKDYNLGLSFFIITLLIFDLTSWQHHFVWLMFSFVVLAYNIIKTRNAVLLGLICIAYLLISWNFKQPTLHPTIVLSTQFYGAIILWGVNFYLLNPKYIKPKNIDSEFFKTLGFGE